MLNKKIQFSTETLPASKQRGRPVEYIASPYTAKQAANTALQAGTVIDCIFRRTNFTLQEQQIVLMTIDHVSEVKTEPEGRHAEILPGFIVAAIENNRPIEIEKLQALRKFTSEILALQLWVSDEMINEYLAAGYSRQSIKELRALTRLAASHQQQECRPCTLLRLACVKSVAKPGVNDR